MLRRGHGESLYDADPSSGSRSSSQTPPPAPARPSRTRRYAAHRPRDTLKHREDRDRDALWIIEDDYLSENDDMNSTYPLQPLNTHQLIDKLLTQASLGMSRGEPGSRHLHSSLLLIRGRLDAESARATDAESRATHLLQRTKDALADASNARAELLSTRESLRLHEVQLAQAQAEIHRAQRTVDQLERARDDAEREAAESRTQARKAKLDHAVIVAREDGRKAGIDEGFKRGRTFGFQEGRHVGYVQDDTSEMEAPLSAVTGPNSTITRVSFRPYSAATTSTRTRPRGTSEPGPAPASAPASKGPPPLAAPVPVGSAFLLRPLRKKEQQQQAMGMGPVSPAPILVLATPPSVSPPTPTPIETLPPPRPSSRQHRPASVPINDVPQRPASAAARQRITMLAPALSESTVSPSHESGSSQVPLSSLTTTDRHTPSPPRRGPSPAFHPQPGHPHTHAYTRAQSPPVHSNPAQEKQESIAFKLPDYSTQYLAPQRTRGNMMVPETPNSLPTVTPSMSMEPTPAPAIYSPFPLPSIGEVSMARTAIRAPSLSPRARVSSPQSQSQSSTSTSPLAPTAAPAPDGFQPNLRQPQPSIRQPSIRQPQPRSTNVPAYDASFSPWAFIHSPVIPEVARAPIVVNSLRVSPTSAPVSAPLSEIDLVKGPPQYGHGHSRTPYTTANSAGQSQNYGQPQPTYPMHPQLRRVETLRDLLGGEIMDAASRRGTPVEELKRSAGVGSGSIPMRSILKKDKEPRSYEVPLSLPGDAGDSAPREPDSRSRSPFDWAMRRVRPTPHRAETSGTIPIAVHSPTETMTVPSRPHSPGWRQSQMSDLLSPQSANSYLWPPDPDAVFAAAVKTVSDSPLMSGRELPDEYDDYNDYDDHDEYHDDHSKSGSTYSRDYPRHDYGPQFGGPEPPLGVGGEGRPLSYIPIRSGPDYFTSTLEKHHIPRGDSRSPAPGPEFDKTKSSVARRASRKAQQAGRGRGLKQHDSVRSSSRSRSRSPVPYAEAPIPAGLVYPESPLRRESTPLRSTFFDEQT